MRIYTPTWQTDSINQNFCLSPVFRQACMLAGVAATERQASKYRNKKGTAYAKRLEAYKSLNISRRH